MKVRFILKGSTVRDWVAHKRNGGFCTVVSLKCRWCGKWVGADDWDPQSDVCDLCTVELRRAGVLENVHETHKARYLKARYIKSYVGKAAPGGVK